METGPSQLVETIVGALIPSAARQHVLGDLRERSRSSGPYLADAARIVPFVVASQVRRHTDSLSLCAQAFLLWILLRSDAPWTLYGVVPLLRLAIPIAATIAALAISRAYSAASVNSLELELVFDRALGRSVVAAVAGVAALWLSQAGLRGLPLDPEWLLPNASLTKGVLGGFLILVQVNVSWDMVFRRRAPLTRALGVDRPLGATGRAERNMSLLFGFLWFSLALQTARIGWRLVHSNAIFGMQPAGGMLIALAIYAVSRVWLDLRRRARLGRDATAEDFRSRFEAHVQAVRWSRLWYIGPFLAARLAMTPPQWWPQVIELTTSAAWSLLLYKLNERWTEMERAALDTLPAAGGPVTAPAPRPAR